MTLASLIAQLRSTETDAQIHDVDLNDIETNIVRIETVVRNDPAIGRRAVKAMFITEDNDAIVPAIEDPLQMKLPL